MTSSTLYRVVVVAFGNSKTTSLRSITGQITLYTFLSLRVAPSRVSLLEVVIPAVAVVDCMLVIVKVVVDPTVSTLKSLLLSLVSSVAQFLLAPQVDQ